MIYFSILMRNPHVAPVLSDASPPEPQYVYHLQDRPKHVVCYKQTFRLIYIYSYIYIYIL